MGAARCADRRHAHGIFADAAQRQAEARMDQPPRAQEHHEQHGERIAVGGVAVEVEIETAEQRPDVHALQPVAAAGQPARAVGRLLQQQAEAERDHDQRQMPKARDHEARGVAEQSGGGGADDEPGQRLAPDEFREQAGGIGGGAEKGGVAERDDAGIAEDEIEREREQRGDRDLAGELEIGRQEEKRQQCSEPERGLERVPARLRLEIFDRRRGRVGQN